jgi:protein gp37
MAENSKIEWTHHTFNPWIGCTKVSPACDNCYAEGLDKRYWGGKHWGPKAERKKTKDWSAPRRWNKDAAAKGIRYRVFCASLADVFDNQIPPDWRASLWQLIEETPHLDWLLLTKRPQNIKKMLPKGWANGWRNVWLGCTVENQVEAERRLPHLLGVPAFIRFLSMEPLLGPVDLTIDSLWNRNCSSCADGCFHCPETGAPECSACDATGKSDEVGIDWIITGGESGPNFRSANPDWFRSLRDQCASADIPFLFKQWEGVSQQAIKKLGRELDGVIHDGYPEVT